ncbi:hydroxypyruvate isomerase [Ventosimonas gracilis]|uniref:Hydroxypyruvate isomerase n=1 Tax=Ventosimonas gracilis TaxID=1680762 RepID=A0A139SVV0_9GAMM|nr:TIM barrel protein [Ventosimonas gracilis]KXU38624.1 hydroxypyruvate isomerase [Ventosimonas gracilis]
MKIAANLSWLFNQAPLHQRVLLAKAAGFDGVEIQFPYSLPAVQLKEALKAADLPLVLFNLPAGDLLEGGAGLAATAQRQAAFNEALKQALHYAAMVRPRFLNVLAGRLLAGISRETAWQTLIENLQVAARECELLGIRLLVEAVSPQEMHGSLISTPEQLLELLAAVNQPNLKVLLDLYHMARQGLHLPKVITQLAPHIGHVQFADCPGRGAPGSGLIDFAAAKRALRENGYNGWLAAEYRPAGDTKASLHWLISWRAKPC